jgi:hypothetical protein
VCPSSYSVYGRTDRQEEEVALRREDAVIFTAWDTWKARSKVCPNTGLDVELMIRNYKLYQWIISESRDLPGRDGSELRN